MSLQLAAGRGVLTYLQWNDMTCNTCGGKSSARCLQAATGTDTQSSCGSELYAQAALCNQAVSLEYALLSGAIQTGGAAELHG